ncbi:hypothetical protein JCM33374_g4086 [Metschnikowia sp. JCM 33374]|nr:hypothetical protein JCM33374_g4086 [Metschnikowia sp. JCM 33374]
MRIQVAVAASALFSCITKAALVIGNQDEIIEQDQNFFENGSTIGAFSPKMAEFDANNYMNSHGSNASTSPGANTIDDAVEPLQKFIARLNGFVNESCFDATAFGDQIVDITKQHADIVHKVRNLLHPKHFSDQYMFANRFFLSMVTYLNSLRYYGLSASAEDDSVASLASLYVRALALHNSQGVPDPSLKGYESAVASLVVLSKSREKVQRYLAKKPGFEWIFFQISFAQAECVLEELQRYLPRQRESSGGMF